MDYINGLALIAIALLTVCVAAGFFVMAHEKMDEELAAMVDANTDALVRYHDALQRKSKYWDLEQLYAKHLSSIR